MTWPVTIAVGLGLPLGALALFYAWSRPRLLLFLVIGSRLLLDSTWKITYMPIIGSISIVKLYSAGLIVFLGFYLWQQRRLDVKPIGILVLVIIASALPGTILSDRWGGFINVSLRWMLPWLFAMLTLYAVEKTSPKQVAWAVMLCLSYAVINQAIGGALFGAKVTEGSASYIGTFEHESLLASLIHGFIALSIGLYGVTRATVIKTVLVFVIVAGHASMYLANYRTAILGLIVSWAFILYLAFPRLGITSKVNMVVFGGIAAGVLTMMFGADLGSKFNDIRLLLDDPGRYFDFTDTGAYRFSEDRTAEGHRLFSGRIELFNSYVAYWMQAPLAEKIFGLGPEFGTDAVGLHAHNEFVSSFVEQGVFGFIVMLFVLAATAVVFRPALRNGDALTISCAALLIGFVVGNLANMNFRDVRSMIMIGIMLGFLEAERRRVKRSTSRVDAQAPAPSLDPRQGRHVLTAD